MHVYRCTDGWPITVGGFRSIYTLLTVDKPQLHVPQCLQCLVDCKGLSQSHSSFSSNPVPVKTAVGDTHSVFGAVYSVLNCHLEHSAVRMIETGMCEALLIIQNCSYRYTHLNSTDWYPMGLVS